MRLLFLLMVCALSALFCVAVQDLRSRFDAQEKRIGICQSNVIELGDALIEAQHRIFELEHTFDLGVRVAAR